MRKALFDRLTTYGPWADQIPAERVFAASSMGVGDDDVPIAADGPFAYFSVGPRDPQPRGMVFATMQVWVHAEPGTYVPIEDALYSARRAFQHAYFPHEGGGWVIEVEWQEESDELRSDELRSIYKTCTWRVVASGEPDV